MEAAVLLWDCSASSDKMVLASRDIEQEETCVHVHIQVMKLKISAVAAKRFLFLNLYVLSQVKLFYLLLFSDIF
jgi:hypothetical protein